MSTTLSEVIDLDCAAPAPAHLGHGLKPFILEEFCRDALDLFAAAIPAASEFCIARIKLALHNPGHRLEALFTVGLALGMRQGEQIGLLWECIDFKAGTLRVEWALQRITVKEPGGSKHTDVHLVPPKQHSRRTITLPQIVLNALVARRRRQQEERELCGSKWRTPLIHRDRKQVAAEFIFTTPIATPFEACNLNKLFQALLKGCGIPRHRFHDLRHTAATLLALQKVPGKAIMNILGWSQISMLERNSHVFDAMRQDAADKMDEVLAARPAASAEKTTWWHPNWHPDPKCSGSNNQ